ncbi:hypothetical protein CDAR_111421 [Caerostris darwini]|uniref:Uncharacterized protein n=1 Tax=Caerostris darwini TaxID=1538125 RepID=A0AAV4WDY1_9ARAC|nr:hypothetical protein CDAR_111421 [Caerostris darwini]
MGEISKRLFGFSLSLPTSFRTTAFASRMRETATQERWVDGRYTKEKPYIYFDRLLFFIMQLSVLIFQTPVSNSAASKRNPIFQSSSGKRRWLWKKKEKESLSSANKENFEYPNYLGFLFWKLFKVPKILKRYLFRMLPKTESNESSLNIPEKTMKSVAATFAPLLLTDLTRSA